jgi:Arc/MetJ-type ribon-helix-helix transcriptional regulator
MPRRAADPPLWRTQPKCLDLETLDTLITAGIAGNRAEAVRWALARIRERPAHEKLRARAQEIEELKAQEIEELKAQV